MNLPTGLRSCMFDYIRADIRRHTYYAQLKGIGGTLKAILIREGIWAMIQYRAHHWVHYRCRVPLVRQLLMLICMVWQKLIMMTTGIEIPATTSIGKGLFIGHPGGIVFHNNAVIGEYCDISHEVTIGRGGRGENAGVPVVGNRVHIGVGAKIIGKITVGNDSAIGANAVVVKDVPEGAVVVGVPAKVVNMKGSFDLIAFEGKPAPPSDTETDAG